MNNVAMQLVAKGLNTSKITDLKNMQSTNQRRHNTSFKDVIYKTKEERQGLNSQNGISQKSIESNIKKMTSKQSREPGSSSIQREDVETISEENKGVHVEEIQKKTLKVEALETEEMVEVDQMLVDLLQNLAKYFQVPIEEVQKTLQQLNMSVGDLLNKHNLITFMTEQLGFTAPTELLTTEGALEQYKEVAKLLQQFVEENEDVQQWLNQKEMTVDPKQPVKIETEGGLKGGVDPALVQGEQREQVITNLSEQKQWDESMPETLKGMEGNADSKNEESMNSIFDGVLQQVVTEKVETVVMNGEIKTIHTQITAKDVFNQIVTGLKVEITQGKQDIMLQLQPEHLGKIGINISKENGVMTGQFMAESEAVKNLIERNVPILRQQLEEQGIELRDIKITVGDSKAFFAGKDHEQNADNFQNAMMQNKKRHTRVQSIDEFLEEMEEQGDKAQRSFIQEDISSIEFQA